MRLTFPIFASESEEADWWYDNREMVADFFEQAAREGRLGRGAVIQRLLSGQPAKIEE